jgi:DNA-binding NtrC family response regulator
LDADSRIWTASLSVSAKSARLPLVSQGTSVAIAIVTVPAILVVDDEPTIRFAMQEYFTAREFEVALADDAATAVTLLGRRSFAVLIADLRLGITDDGLHVVAHARRVAPATRIIVLTAYGNAELQRRATALGVSAFLHKPTPLAELAQVVLALLADDEARDRR